MKKLLLDTYRAWSRAGSPRLAAALTYYALFSFVPLLLVAFSIAGIFFASGDVRADLLAQVKSTLGPAAGQAVADILEGSKKQSHGVVASVLGVVMTLVGAVGLMGQLQDSLNAVWGVKAKEDADWKCTLKRKGRAFAVVVGGGLLLLLTHVASSALTFIHEYQPGWLGFMDGAWLLVPHVLTFALTVGLFVMLFQVLPDADIESKDVLLGAVGTAVLFSLGKFLLSLYFEYAAPASSYGAAGSLVILLLWMYWSAQILFFGAEFTKVYSLSKGKQIHPMDCATLIEEAGGKPAPTGAPETRQRGGTPRLAPGY